MKVTNVQVFPLKKKFGKILASAAIVIDDAFVVRALRVMDGENGLFVGYPGHPQNDPQDGKNFNALVQPITREFREHIENVVLEEYQRVKANEANQD